MERAKTGKARGQDKAKHLRCRWPQQLAQSGAAPPGRLSSSVARRRPPTAVCLCGSSSSYVRVKSLLLGHTRPIVAMKDCEKESSANRTKIELFPTPAQAADGTGGLSGMQQRSSSRVSSAQPPGADSGRPQARVERTEVVMERLRRDAVAAPVRRGLLAASGHGCGSMRLDRAPESPIKRSLMSTSYCLSAGRAMQRAARCALIPRYLIEPPAAVSASFWSPTTSQRRPSLGFEKKKNSLAEDHTPLLKRSPIPPLGCLFSFFLSLPLLKIRIWVYGGGVPSSHPSLGLSVFFVSFFLSRASGPLGAHVVR